MKPILKHSMKGYELYSWRCQHEQNTWCFVLLSGTNRIKKSEEVISNEAIIKGVDAIKMELEKLPKGDKLFWLSAFMYKIDTKLELPPEKIIQDIENTCRKLEVNLSVGVAPN